MAIDSMHEIARKLQYVRPSHVLAPFLNRTQHRRLRKSLQGFKFPSEFVMHIHKSEWEHLSCKLVPNQAAGQLSLTNILICHLS